PTFATTAAHTAHVLDEHQFLMPCAVVMHHREHGKPMMLRRPQYAWRVIQIAVGLDVDHDLPAALGCKRRPDRRRCAVAHATRTLASEIAVRLFVNPQLSVVRAVEVARRREYPIFVFDERPQLGVDARGRNRSRVPSRTLLIEG